MQKCIEFHNSLWISASKENLIFLTNNKNIKNNGLTLKIASNSDEFFLGTKILYNSDIIVKITIPAKCIWK